MKARLALLKTFEGRMEAAAASFDQIPPNGKGVKRGRTLTDFAEEAGNWPCLSSSHCGTATTRKGARSNRRRRSRLLRSRRLPAGPLQRDAELLGPVDEGLIGDLHPTVDVELA